MATGVRRLLHLNLSEAALSGSRLLRSRAALWVAFVVVHGWITVLGTLLLLHQSFWDLDLYRHWMAVGVTDHAWPVLDGDWVYPAAALLPMRAAAALGGVTSTIGFAVAWCAIVAVLDAIAVTVLLRVPAGPRGHDPVVGAWWWLAFLLALGPVAIGRLDAIIAPIVVVALVLAARHPRVSSALLTLGAWIKVAPGAVLLPLVLAVRRPVRQVVAPAAAVSAVVVGAVAAGGGLTHLTSFLDEQGARGLQLESVTATPWLLTALVSSSVKRYYNNSIVTYEIAGPGTQGVADLLGLLLPLAVAVAAALAWWARRRSTEDFLLRGALLVVTVLIVFNKVGSPQFIGWLAPPVAVALAAGRPRWRRTAQLVLGLALTTQIVFPLAYGDVLYGGVGITVLLAARNVGLVVLLGLTVTELVAVPRDQPDDVAVEAPPADPLRQPIADRV